MTENEQTAISPDEAYSEAIDYLDENYAYFLTNVLNIGHPTWEYGIPTAAVTLPKVDTKKGEKGNKFGFIFNPEFASQLTQEEMGFVLAHETMHIVLYHLSLSQNFDDKEIFNIAADCYDDQTEVLTDSGWKLFKDVDVYVDKVATRAKDGTLEYQVPDKYIENEYNGDLIAYDGKRLNFAVTPNHNMLVRPHHQSTRHKTNMLTAAEVEAGYRYLVPKTVTTVDSPDGVFDLSEIVPTTAKSKGKSHNTPAVERAKFARFLGMWLADGKKFDRLGGKNGFTTKITQTKPEGIAYIDKVMGELGWEHRRSVAVNGETVWTITNDNLAHYLKELQEGTELRLPSDVLSWSISERQALLEGFLVGDGTFSTQASRYTCMTNTSRRLLDDFQALLVSIGKCGNISPTFDGGARIIKGAEVDCAAVWKLHIDLRPDAVLESARMTRVPYKGKVYCLSVPNHTLMVRRHGKMMWCGNCVINDYLRSAGLEQIEGTVRGEDVVGFDCSNCTVTEVYNTIENDPELMEKLKGDGEGDGGFDFVEIDGHDWMHNPDAIKQFGKAMKAAGISPDDLPDDLEEILSETANEYKKTQMAGMGQAQREEFMREQKITMKWVELLEKVDPDMFYQPGAGPKPVTTFRQPRRKLAHMSSFSKAILPSLHTPDKGDMARKSDKKPAIVLALDTSGSIGNDTANKFINLARSIPQDKVKVHACTFTTEYMPLDLDNPRWRGGGTDFSPIEQFIRRDVVPNNDGKYPKAVVVVTDGYASFYRGMKPSTAHASGWHWLLLDDHQRYSAQTNLSHFGFKPESFDVVDGYVDGTVDWYAA